VQAAITKNLQTINVEGFLKFMQLRRRYLKVSQKRSFLLSIESLVKHVLKTSVYLSTK